MPEDELRSMQATATTGLNLLVRTNRTLIHIPVMYERQMHTGRNTRDHFGDPYLEQAVGQECITKFVVHGIVWKTLRSTLCFADE